MIFLISQQSSITKGQFWKFKYHFETCFLLYKDLPHTTAHLIPIMSFRIISSRTDPARPVGLSERPSIIVLNLMKNILTADLEYSSENCISTHKELS